MIPNIATLSTSLILYPIAIIMTGLAIRYRKASIVAGLLGLGSGLFWIFGVESLKTVMIQQEISLGGTDFLIEMTKYYASKTQFSHGALVSIFVGIAMLSIFFYQET